MRYLLAFCILAWVGCTTPVLDIEGLEKAEPEDTTVIPEPPAEQDVENLIYYNGLGSVYSYNLENESSRRISPPNAFVLDFDVTRGNTFEVKMLIDEFSNDSVLVFDFAVNSISERWQTRDFEYDGLFLDFDGRVLAYDPLDVEIDGYGGAAGINVNYSNGVLLRDAVFYRSDRVALLIQNGTGGRLDAIHRYSENVVYFYQSSYEMIALTASENYPYLYAVINNASITQTLFVYNTSTETNDFYSIPIYNRTVVDADAHPYQENKIYLLVKDAQNDFQLVLYNIAENTVTDVVDFTNISNNVAKIQVK